ncbi:general transcription factor II-I repeat domain-containing protein 2-like [Oratosquilla oratoria]|uniref:general transcription factor II-I repeat domain-containing protein 2-like n=1 Tax=Oratosquilla oratoria TaxID=337810 RepID=UPI003F75C408
MTCVCRRGFPRLIFFALLENLIQVEGVKDMRSRRLSIHSSLKVNLEQRSAFESVRLSFRTVCRRIEDTSDNVHDLLKTRSSKFVAFSLALDESTDTKNTAQMAVFIRGVTADLQVCEEFLQLVPLRGTSTGQDICDAVLQCVDQHSLDLSRLVRVPTDGAPAMGEEGRRFAAGAPCEAAGYTQPINMMRYIIHQESLCAKSANPVDVMSVVVKIVISILSRSLNHRQFQQEIATFLRQTNLPHADQFSGPRWLAHLVLLTDIKAHLNALKMLLQGKDILMTDMYAHITAFEVKLRLWKARLALVRVRVLAADFKLFTARFDFPVEDAPASLQMELVELQCNDEMKAKFRTSSPLSFFHDIVLSSNKFQKYITHVQRIVAMFGSTYCCEQLFSKRKNTKSHLRSQLSDQHLNDILLLSTSTIELNMKYFFMVNSTSSLIDL